MSRSWLKALLDPAAVAIVGSSDNPQRASGRIQYYLDRWGYKGDVHPVNPSRATVQGKKAYAKVSDIPYPVDVAVIMVAAERAPAAVRDCAEAGIGVAIVGSSGFSETGPAGAALEEELSMICAETGIRLIGPNGNGVVAVRSNFTASFMSGLDTERFELTDHGVALVSQSGAVGAFIFNLGQGSGLGVGTFVSTGNETDVGFAEIIASLAADPATTAILGYVEGLRDGPAFVDAARAAEAAGKPVAILKVGSTEVGARAAASHTASLAGADRVYDGVFRQLGVARATSITHLLDVGRLFAYYGDRVGTRLTVATISGGAGILAADTAAQTGLEMAQWSQEWQARLAEHVPSFASTANPVDATGSLLTDDATLVGVLAVVDEHPETDVVVLILGNGEQMEAAISSRLVAIARDMHKPVVVVWVGGSGLALERLNAGGVAAFDDPVRCINALASVATRRRPSGGSDGGDALPTWTPSSEGDTSHVLDEVASKELLAPYGLPVVTEVIVTEVADVAGALDRVGLPAVAKLRSKDLTHKSDVGGVRTGLSDAAAVARAVEDLLELGRKLGLEGADVVLAEHVDIGIELLVGSSVDPTFGPVISVGVGGVLTEALQDVSVLLCDFTVEDLDAALSRLHARRLLEGYRGLPRVDAAMLMPAVRAVAAAATDHAHRVRSIDVNPLVVTHTGRVVAVDALVELEDGER